MSAEKGTGAMLCESPTSKSTCSVSDAARLQSGVEDLQALATECASEETVSGSPPEDYLSLNQLCARIPYQPQTIRNLIAQGVVKKGEHFLQRQRHGKVVFVWSAMQRWLRQRQERASMPEPFIPSHHARTRKSR